MKMWSGRFRQPLNPEFEAWQRSFPFDKQLLTQELTASRAYAKALAEIGVLSPDELKQTLSALEGIGIEAAANPAAVEDEEAEDVHHYVERQLVDRIGEVGYKLHSGRSRNEQIATDLRLYVRAQIDSAISALTELMETILHRAEEAGERSMPAYTHLQRAEPVLVAHWLLTYIEMLQRDADRLLDCRKRLNVCPLGSGAIAGSTLALGRNNIAHELGFDAPTANSIDATSDRDFAVEFLQTLSLLGIHLSRWSEELIIFSTKEFGFVRLPESFSTGSSAMPQKQNPDALELIRAKSARLIGNAQAVLINMKGLPLAYNKDLQETQEPVFDSAKTALAVLRHAIGFMREVQFNYEVMEAAAQSDFMNAFAAATYLVGKGVPFRRAHEIIGAAVRLCMDKHCELQELPLAELRGLHPSFDQDFYDAVQLQAVLDCHDVIGGTARVRVKQALAKVSEKISQLRGAAYANA